VAAVQAAKIHLVALHAADVPYLVNQAGFVPWAVLGSAQGASGNHLDLAVLATSPIRSLADVRGRLLTCTRPDSITGYRAAIAVLLGQAGMQPDVDYAIHFSHGQKRSIEGLLDGTHQVAALSDDKLQELLGEGELKEGQLRLIYESQVIPRLTIGCLHQLHPELAAKARAAALAFDNQGAAADAKSAGPMRFVPIDYQADFEFVRQIDDAFDPRFGQSPKEQITP
jgi:phosphonate transport system substrate-binding protein